MLIKFDAEESLVDRLKMQYGQRVASKAFAMAAEDSISLSLEVRDLRAQLADARRLIQVQRQTLESARSAASLLLEKVGQQDLLDSADL